MCARASLLCEETLPAVLPRVENRLSKDAATLGWASDVSLVEFFVDASARRVVQSAGNGKKRAALPPANPYRVKRRTMAGTRIGLHSPPLLVK